MTEEIQYLRKEISFLEQEIRDVRGKFESRNKPWYLETSTILSALALLFSFGTTFVSYYKAAQEEVLSAKTQLGDLIAEIANLPQENTEILLKYQNDPNTMALLNSQINAKNLSLGSQADSIIDRIESSIFGRGRVQDIEYYTVGNAMIGSYQFKKAKDLIVKSLEHSRSGTQATTALRSLSAIELAFGNISSARKYLEEALLVFNDRRFSEESDLTKATTNTVTLIQWAGFELQQGNCKRHSELIDNAKVMMSKVPQSSVAQQMNSQIDYSLKSAATQCGDTINK